jgi:hypothetical protein
MLHASTYICSKNSRRAARDKKEKAWMIVMIIMKTNKGYLQKVEKG